MTGVRGDAVLLLPVRHCSASLLELGKDTWASLIGLNSVCMECLDRSGDCPDLDSLDFRLVTVREPDTDLNALLSAFAAPVSDKFSQSLAGADFTLAKFKFARIPVSYITLSTASKVTVVVISGVTVCSLRLVSFADSEGAFPLPSRPDAGRCVS